MKEKSVILKDMKTELVLSSITSVSDIKQEETSPVLVSSFMTEYRQYLKPSDIDAKLTSWDEGDNSVQKFYEDYYASERREFEEGHLDFWIEARITRKLVGFATFEIEKDNPKALYMNLLAVNPEYQQQGIGKQLVHAINTLELIKDIEKIHVLLRKKNRGGATFYHKLGFQENPDYSRPDNFVDMTLLEAITYTYPAPIPTIKDSRPTFYSSIKLKEPTKGNDGSVLEARKSPKV